jgi:FKBP-type peptidyl-prolyl cis-trans isomerase
MATPRSQRIGIWIIAVVLTMGTLGSFLVMALSVQNQSTDQALLQKESTDYQAAVTAQAQQLSDKYYADFSKYSSIPAVFNTGDVTKLSENDLKIGDGEVVTADTEYNAYYIGWNPKGVVFDQSISDGALKAPIAGGNLITGWNEGVIGMKIGGVRELSIPSDKAYGETGSGDNIPPNTPIKFIVMIIPKVADVPMPAELLQYYQSQYSTGS